MNIEKRLFQIIGEEAGYIHTARSRNDQVITDFKIWIKSATKEININLDKIIKSTLKLLKKILKLLCLVLLILKMLKLFLLLIILWLMLKCLIEIKKDLLII